MFPDHCGDDDPKCNKFGRPLSHQWSCWACSGIHGKKKLTKVGEFKCSYDVKACFFSSFDIEECSLKHLRLNSWDACRGSELGSLWKKSTYWRFKKRAPRVQSWLDKVSLNMSTKYTYITYNTSTYIHLLYTYTCSSVVLDVWSSNSHLGSRNASSILRKQTTALRLFTANDTAQSGSLSRETGPI